MLFNSAYPGVTIQVMMGVSTQVLQTQLKGCLFVVQEFGQMASYMLVLPVIKVLLIKGGLSAFWLCMIPLVLCSSFLKHRQLYPFIFYTCLYCMSFKPFSNNGFRNLFWFFSVIIPVWCSGEVLKSISFDLQHSQVQCGDFSTSIPVWADKKSCKCILPLHCLTAGRVLLFYWTFTALQLFNNLNPRACMF